MSLQVALAALLLTAARGADGATAAAWEPSAMVDLTYPFDSDTVYWPGGASFIFTQNHRGPIGDIPWLEINSISTPEHVGTHFDAPAHLARGRWRVHDVPTARLVGPAVVIDISWRARRDPDTQVRPQDLLDWEAEYGPIPAGSIVLMRSGWGARWPHMAAVFGSGTWNDTTTFHFPGFHVDAATWLLENRHFVGVGVDTPSVDYGQSRDFAAHRALFAENIYAVENVAHLGKLPPSGATLLVMPMLIRAGSGAPCRIVGVLPKVAHVSGCRGVHGGPMAIGILLCLVVGVLCPDNI